MANIRINILYRKIIKAGIIAGTLDILAAFVYYYIRTGQMKFFDVLKFIASGIYGKDAFADGSEMIFIGLALHYLIAFSFTVFFFLTYPHIKLLSRNLILSAVLYGVFVWMVMNIVVVPISNVTRRPLTIENVLINVIILIVCIGLPLSKIGGSYYKAK